jgi:hypothetical protein
MTPLPFIDLSFSTDDTEASDSPRHRWLIRHLDGSVASHSFSPPASRAEVASWYPGAVFEPEPDTEANGPP